jgi:hypothetical protein
MDSCWMCGHVCRGRICADCFQLRYVQLDGKRLRRRLHAVWLAVHERELAMKLEVDIGTYAGGLEFRFKRADIEWYGILVEPSITCSPEVRRRLARQLEGVINQVLTGPEGQ